MWTRREYLVDKKMRIFTDFFDVDNLKVIQNDSHGYPL